MKDRFISNTLTRHDTFNLFLQVQTLNFDPDDDSHGYAIPDSLTPDVADYYLAAAQVTADELEEMPMNPSLVGLSKSEVVTQYMDRDSLIVSNEFHRRDTQARVADYIANNNLLRDILAATGPLAT